MKKVRIFNVPNTLTFGRLLLAIIVFVMIAQDQFLAALVCFAIAAITDTLDGYLARRLGQATALGRQLDPLVDKVLISGGFIYLLTVPETGLAPWMVTTIIVRELLIQGLRSHLEGQGQAFGAMMAGKIKTVMQCLSICGILACLWLRPSAAWLYGRDTLTWLAVGLTLYSGFGYLTLAWPKFRNETA